MLIYDKALNLFEFDCEVTLESVLQINQYLTRGYSVSTPNKKNKKTNNGSLFGARTLHCTTLSLNVLNVM